LKFPLVVGEFLRFGSALKFLAITLKIEQAVTK